MNKRRYITKFYLKIVAISFFSLAVNAESKEKIITVCIPIKEVFLRINTDFLEEKERQTSFKKYEKGSDEKYTLSKLITVANEEDKMIFLKNRYYNISYSATTPFISWDTLNLIREGEMKVEVLNESNPLVIRAYEPHVQEKVYFFNLDRQGNGTMSFVSTRWYSFMNAVNHQSLTYAICKKP